MPAKRDAIAVALGEGSPWDEGVKSLIKWQLRLCGDFKEALWVAISRADEKNLALLEQGFPKEVSAFRKWTRGGLAETLRKSGLDL